MARVETIRRRLTRNVLLLVILVGGAIMAATFLGSKRAVETLSRSLIRRVTDQTKGRLGRFFDPARRQLDIAMGWKERDLLGKAEPRDLDALLVPILRQMPQVSSVLLADERGREYMLLRSGSAWRNRLTRRDVSTTRVWIRTWSDADPEPVEREEDDDYDPRRRPWFQGALAKAPDGPGRGAVHWTEPYRFYTTKEPGITASVAIDMGEGFRHVFGFDVLLGDISRFTTGPELEVSERGFVFVVDESSRRVVGLPRMERFQGDEAIDAAVNRTLQDLDDPVMLAADAAAPASGEPFQFRAAGESWWGGMRRFELAPGHALRIGVVVPRADLLGDLVTLRWIIGAIVALALGIAAWRAFALADRVSDPIEALVAGSERIRTGDLEPGEAIQSDLLEVQRLADSQDRMRAGLAVLLKLERDLQVARQIQQNTFPNTLPRLAGFEVEAWSEPADETGGDTYDVIGLAGEFTRASLVATEEGAERAVLMLADATGHGIGPALSALQLRAMLRMGMRMGGELADIVRHMNVQLCEDLPAARFLTTWFGQLDPVAGTLRTFSAGQGPLLHYHAAEDRCEWMRADAPPLGILPVIPIAIGEPVGMQPGDLYIVFSDGIYEAMDPDGALFGEERVEGLVREHRGLSPRDLLVRVREAVDAFARGRPADDDRTAVIIKRL